MEHVLWTKTAFSTPVWQLALLGAASLVLIHIIWLGFFSPLSKIPGPFWARFSSFYLFFRHTGCDSHAFYRQWHDKYGPVVRTGPHTVSIADPDAIPIIYNTGGKFIKVKRFLYSMEALSLTL